MYTTKFSSLEKKLLQCIINIVRRAARSTAADSSTFYVLLVSTTTCTARGVVRGPAWAMACV